jgi:hypothetical protein
MHQRGDGSFTVDGGTLDLRKRMVKWRHLPQDAPPRAKNTSSELHTD